MITAAARGADGAVRVTVGPGGGLHDLTLSESALQLDPNALADAVLAAVNLATARADQRLRSTMDTQLGAHAEPVLAGLGLAVEPGLAEAAEDTTPRIWDTT